MATTNSDYLGSGQKRGRRGWTLLLILAAAGTVAAAPPVSTAADPVVARLARIHAEAQARFQRETNSSEAAWQYGRACFDMADLATNNAQRAEFALQGIEATRAAVARAPKSAPAHYYLGLNLGQLAQTKKLGALHLLGEIETAWKTSLELDPMHDFAGAHRALGILYRDAPGWPVSLGSRGKARAHLLKALELAPEYPENQLYWLETLWRWGEKKAVQAKLAAVETLLAEARTKFNGENWVLSWRDWEARWQKIKDLAADKKLKSPHDSN
jgi:hypothetical protein